MCRIAGIVDQSQPVVELQLAVKAMCNSLQHGGPDDEGIWTSGNEHLVFGHRRLSLIDLSAAGHQPMFYQNDQLAISYNGEIYNYPELKNELKALGYHFTSQSDTEVVLAAFSEWGKNAFARFNGMFAFALWDDRNKSIYLVRDPSGIKPLYYSHQNNSLAFASELRAFQYLPQKFEQNKNWPVYLMAYGHIPEPITTLKDVKPLQKGTFLQYQTHTGTCSTEIYYHYSYLENISNRKNALERVATSLQQSVKRHLISDAPIGVFLSGGIDSSLIAILANEIIPDHLNTLSLFFTNGLYSEKRYQTILLKQLQCNHHEYLLRERDFHEFLPDVLKAMDMPSSDGINSWFISKLAKERGLKAVLSGLGGDELFGGYPSFSRMKTTAMLQKLPAKILQAGKFSRSKKLKRLVYLTLPGVKGKYLFLRGHFIPSEIASHLNMDEKQVWDILEESPLLPDINYLTKQNQASWMEMNMYMQNQLLRDSDVMSMAHGVEIRVPFLDKEFMKLVMQITSSTKYAGFYDKQLLIDAFKNKLPERIWKRKKMGFSFPFKEWLVNNEMIKEEIYKSGQPAIQHYELFLSGKKHWSQILTLVLAKNKMSEPSRTLSYA